MVAQKTESEEEDSFLQMTMGDIGNATVEFDSFCRLRGNDKADADTDSKRYGSGTGHEDFTRTSLSGKQHLTRHPLERYPQNT